MGEMELLVFQQSYQNVIQFTASFTIDMFMGGDLTIQVDVGHTFANKVIGIIQMESARITVFDDLEIDSNGVYQFYEAEGSHDVGAWSGNTTVQVNLTSKIDFLSLKITSKPSSNTLPLRTRCWTSAGCRKGHFLFELSLQTL
jgi:hypothetical protein